MYLTIYVLLVFVSCAYVVCCVCYYYVFLLYVIACSCVFLLYVIVCAQCSMPTTLAVSLVHQLVIPLLLRHQVCAQSRTIVHNPGQSYTIEADNSRLALIAGTRSNES